MSKSAIYAVNTIAGTAIASGSNYPVTQIVRRFGCDLASNGVGIVCKSSGYYKVNGTVSLTATTAGNITATLMNNGVAVPGATSTATAVADATIALPLDAIVKVNCCGNPAELSIEITGVETTSINAELSAFKL